MAGPSPRPCTVSVATPPGKGGIAVITLTGEGSAEILDRVVRRKPVEESDRVPAGPLSPLPTCRLALGHLLDRGQIVDEVLVARVQGGYELNSHGGPLVVRRALEVLARCGATVAAPAWGDPLLPHAHPQWSNPAIGRELKRALPAAGSPLVAAVLSAQWSGGISRLACQPRSLLAELGDPAPEGLRDRPYQWAADRFPVVQRLLDPPEVVLVGPPNAGKSTLANALTGRQGSIVHDAPGTTRDWVRERAVLLGRPVWLTDTAGLWSVPDGDHHGVDAEAVRRARARAETADLVLLVAPHRRLERPDWLAPDRPVLHVASQMDRLPDEHPAGSAGPIAPDDADLAVSAWTGEGLEQLAGEIVRGLGLTDLNPDRPCAFTARQRDILLEMQRAVAGPLTCPPAELVDRLLRGDVSSRS